jgi:hypothetical protein
MSDSTSMRRLSIRHPPPSAIKTVGYRGAKLRPLGSRRQVPMFSLVVRCSTADIPPNSAECPAWATYGSFGPTYDAGRFHRVGADKKHLVAVVYTVAPDAAVAQSAWRHPFKFLVHSLDACMCSSLMSKAPTC